jgi:hypothetical protein
MAKQAGTLTEHPTLPTAPPDQSQTGLTSTLRNERVNHKCDLEPLIRASLLCVAVPKRMTSTLILVPIRGNLEIQLSMRDDIELLALSAIPKHERELQAPARSAAQLG